MFLIGVLPALLSVVVIRYLHEPDAWKNATRSDEDKAKAGSLRELFGTPRWRYNVIIGMLLASVGVIGLWGIGFFSIDLNRTVCRKWAQREELKKEKQSLDRRFIGSLIADPTLLDRAGETVKPKFLISRNPKCNYPLVIYSAALRIRQAKAAASDELNARDLARYLKNEAKVSNENLEACMAYYADATVTPAKSFDATVKAIVARRVRIDETVGWWGSITSILFNLGACFGIYAFAVVTERLGRRPTFTIFFLASFFSTLLAFLCMNRPADILWMVPLMGFFQLALFGGYAIFFPELFPTRLRSTAVSFCYNIGRYVAAFGPAIFGLLTHRVFSAYDEPMRYAGAMMCGVFIVGIVITWLAPETRGRPLPE
jgi:MFS family permease